MKEPLQHRTHSRQRHSRLLLLDDDEALLKALSGTFQNHLPHIALDACQTSHEAMALLQAHPYATIISDVNMPSMNGLEFVGKVNEIYPHTPIVLISGHADDVMISQAFTKGITDFVPKPIDRERLLSTVSLTVHFSRLRSLLERQQAAVSLAKQQYLSIIGDLGESTGEWAQRLRALDSDILIRSLDAQFKSEQKLQALSTRSTRRLISLDAFILKTMKASQKTLAELTAARQNLLCLSNKHPRRK